MWDVSRKTKTLRMARAEATLTVAPATVELLKAGKLPKGDPIPVAKIAAIQAAKNAPLLIPYCHTLPLESVDVSFDIKHSEINVHVQVKAIARTGVEMEALAAASAAALTLYDMLKAVDKNMEIKSTRLLEKTGGKTQATNAGVRHAAALRAHVVVVSDSVAAGRREDTSGKAIMDRLASLGVVDVGAHVTSDDPDEIETLFRNLSHQGVDLIVSTGGTGAGPRDNVPEVMDKIIERGLPGVPEAMRAHGQERTPFSMLSRGKAGILGRTLIVNLPGSHRAVEESMDALFPGIFHAVQMIRGQSHDEPE